ncbi:MAG TPA: DNA polymerase A family protein, partial [Blastocatellia bacterium]|nr:DNA polymerase A family protein [Blastocatellia bacterium]
GTLNAEVGAEIERVRAEIFDLAGCQFDLNSPAKVAAILYDKLGVPCKGTTDGGKPSVDREALSDVRGYHPVVDAILRYREIDKLASTFLNVLPAMVDSSGRIHPEFKPLGPKGGRFSCSDPNVQQIPARSELGKRLREAFITETGCKLVVADYSQMELRVLAHFSRDPDLVAAYTSEQEIDLHTLTASKMFKKAIADVTGQERKVAKMINFGIAYGITPTGLFNRLRPEGVDVTEAQCEKFIEDYFNTYKGVRTFLERVITVIKRRGYVRSLFGRRRRLTGRTARERRQAENFIIQASAADIAKDAMVRLDKALPESARLIAQIHDEFIVECPESDAEQVREVMIEVMSEAPAGFTIPLKVDAHIGESWGDAKG